MNSLKLPQRLSVAISRRALLGASVVAAVPVLPRYARAENAILRAGGVGTAVSTLDPGRASSAPDFWILWAMFNGLTKFDANMNIVPDLATSWSTPAANRWVFKLRPGVKFHDGNELTADDVKFTFDRVMSPDFASPSRSKLAVLSEVIVVDSLTVELRTKEPFAPLLTYLTNTRTGTQIVSRKAVESMSAEEFARRPVGTGPFKMQNWLPNEKVTFKAHKDYFVNGEPIVSGLEVPLIADESTAVNAILGGSLDFASSAPFDQIKRLSSMPSVSLYRAPGLNTRYIALNLTRSPFNDVHFRRALSMAFDRRILVEAVLFGEGEPQQGVIPSSLSWAYDKTPRPDCQFNPGKALEELAKSKYGKGTKAVVLTWGASWWRRWAELFVTQVNQVLGTALTVEVSDANTATQRFNKGDYDALVWGWTGLTDPDEYLRDCFRTGAVRNTGGYSNTELDHLLDGARGELDQAQRGRMYIEAERRLVEDMPAIFSFTMNTDQVMSSRVTNYQGLPYQAFGAQFAAVRLA